VTAHEWLTTADARAMLEWLPRCGAPCWRCYDTGEMLPSLGGGLCRLCLGASPWPRPSQRKLRLVACACCRFAWEHLPDDRARAAVEAAERFAEGRASADQLRQAYDRTGWQPAFVAAYKEVNLAAVRDSLRYHVGALTAAFQSRLATAWHERLGPALKEAHRTAARGGRAAVKAACKAAEDRIRAQIDGDLSRLIAQAERGLADAVRDVINPARPIPVRPEWLDANGGLARMIAAGIDLDGRFDELPVLADALEEGGCDDAAILAHARGPVHFRGCWLVDTVLGKS
jgi:hypothetical protein